MEARLSALAPVLSLTAGARADESQELAFDRLSTEDGPSRNHVDAVLQDSRGFLWFGTRGGLNRFDGQRIVKYGAPLRSGGRTP